jgi:hypothetical protein
MKNWIPEMIRAEPAQPFVLRWLVETQHEPRDVDATVPSALGRAGTLVLAAEEWRWELSVPWQTLVYGLIRRDVDEHATLHLSRGDQLWELQLRCLPAETHTAHAAGAAGVAAMTAAVWLIGGWLTGLLPGLATALAGGLWADVSRVMAMQNLERRLRRVVEDVGSELWPHAPAQLLPPPTRVV